MRSHLAFHPKPSLLMCVLSVHQSKSFFSHKVSVIRSVCASTRENMLLSRAVVAVSFLIAAFIAISAMPQPGVIRERHVIHAPIKFRIIHHHNIKKVPIIIKKHLHYYKPSEGIHHGLIENHPNQIHVDENDDHYNQFEFYQQKGIQKYKTPKIPKIPIQQNDHDVPEEEEEEYEEPEQSQEEQYEDYEDE